MFRNPERISYQELKEKIQKIQNQQDKQITCLAYATGSRVSELNQITKDGLYYTQINNNKYLVITAPTLKKRKIKIWDDQGPHYDLTKNKRYRKEPPPKRERHAPVRIDEDWLIQPILQLAQNTTSNKLVPLDRTTIWRRLKKSTGINPHGFRKLRATHLVTQFNFTAHQLKQFFDWSTVAPSDFYVKLSLQDIAY